MKTINPADLQTFRSPSLFLYNTGKKTVFVKRYGDKIIAERSLAKQKDLRSTLPKMYRKFIPIPYEIYKMQDKYMFSMEYKADSVTLKDFLLMNPSKTFKSRIENQLKSLLKAMIRQGFLHRYLRHQHILVDLKKKNVVLVDFSRMIQHDPENFEYNLENLTTNDDFFALFDTFNIELYPRQMHEKNLFDKSLTNRFEKLKIK